MTKTSRPLTPAVRGTDRARRCASIRPIIARLLALDRWLKKHNIPAIAGIDTRALTSRIRENGMPHGVIAHDRGTANFDIARAAGGKRKTFPASSASTSPRT